MPIGYSSDFLPHRGSKTVPKSLNGLHSNYRYSKTFKEISKTFTGILIELLRITEVFEDTQSVNNDIQRYLKHVQGFPGF